VVYVNGRRVVDNDGLHGGAEKCGSVELKPGGALVRADGFEEGRGSEAEIVLRYSGPDTDYHKVLAPSTDPEDH